MYGPRDDLTTQSNSEREIRHNITYTWNVKNYTNGLIYKAERDTKTQKTNLWLAKGVTPFGKFMVTPPALYQGPNGLQRCLQHLHDEKKWVQEHVSCLRDRKYSDDIKRSICGWPLLCQSEIHRGAHHLDSFLTGWDWPPPVHVSLT